MMHAEVLHHIPGRMRIRVPAAKRDSEQLEHIRNAFDKLPVVLDVSANAGLGTLIIHYEPAAFSGAIQRITEHASKADLFLLHPPPEQHDDVPVSNLDRAVDRFFGKVNRIVEAGTGHAVNLKEIFPFAIILYAVVFVDKAIAASQWLSWLQFAFSSYLEMHDGEPIVKIGDSVESVRAELQALREELRTHFENQK